MKLKPSLVQSRVKYIVKEANRVAQEGQIFYQEIEDSGGVTIQIEGKYGGIFHQLLEDLQAMGKRFDSLWAEVAKKL